jgi:hypothetical protein
VKRRCEQPRTRSTAQKCPSGETRTGCATLSDDVIAHCSELVFTPPEPAHGLPFAYGTYTTRFGRAGVRSARRSHHSNLRGREGVKGGGHISRFWLISHIQARQLSWLSCRSECLEVPGSIFGRVSFFRLFSDFLRLLCSPIKGGGHISRFWLISHIQARQLSWLSCRSECLEVPGSIFGRVSFFRLFSDFLRLLCSPINPFPARVVYTLPGCNTAGLELIEDDPTRPTHTQPCLDVTQYPADRYISETAV